MRTVLAYASRYHLECQNQQLDSSTDLSPPPNQPASLADTGKPRSWTDSTGKYKIEGLFLGLENNAVKLHRTDGKELSVPLDRLSKADRELAKRLQAAAASDNPFE